MSLTPSAGSASGRSRLRLDLADRRRHPLGGAEPEDLIGVIDPMQMEETRRGLEVGGKVDIERSAKGQEAWRAMRSGSIGLSFGYLIEESQPHEGKGLDLLSVDVFEVSLTATPMNGDTMVLDMKSASAGPFAAILAGVTARAAGSEKELERDVANVLARSEEQKKRAAAEAKWLATPITIKSFPID